jgi:hypothetical protein
MQYIRVHEIEKLLTKYHDMHAMSEAIRSQMQIVLDSNDISDDIAGMALKHSTAEDISSFSPGAVSDRTGKIAIDYQSTLTHEKKEAFRELRGELLAIEIAINKLDIGLSILSRIQKDIVKARCCDGLRWKEIDNEINKAEYAMSVSSMKSKCKEGIQRLCIVSRITVSEYQEVSKLFNFEEGGDEDYGR